MGSWEPDKDTPTSAPELGDSETLWGQLEWGSVAQGSLWAELLLRGTALGSSWVPGRAGCSMDTRDANLGAAPAEDEPPFCSAPAAAPAHGTGSLCIVLCRGGAGPGRDWSLLQSWRDQIWLQSGFMMGAQLCWALPCACSHWHRDWLKIQTELFVTT